jgi:hypothetical protein
MTMKLESPANGCRLAMTRSVSSTESETLSGIHDKKERRSAVETGESLNGGALWKSYVQWARQMKMSGNVTRWFQIALTVNWSTSDF